MRVVQVLGTNGAGKSALLRALAEKDAGASFANGYTTLPTHRFILVGNYLDKAINTPGADGIHSKVELLKALTVAADWARQQPEEWALAWEGIIIMTRQYHPEYLKRGLTPLYLVLSIPVDECFARIAQRSGKTRDQLKKDGQIVIDRAQGVRRLAQWLKTQEAELLWLDGKTLPEFNAGRVLRTVWHRGPTRRSTTPVTTTSET